MVVVLLHQILIFTYLRGIEQDQHRKVEALGKYYPNSPMLAAMVAVSGVMEKETFLKEMKASFEHKFAKKPEVIEGNMKALELTFEAIQTD